MSGGVRPSPPEGTWKTKTVLAGVIKQAYIVNSLDFDELCRLCKETLDDGNNVIIFPEGTRTPRHGSTQYKKGAARIAYYAGCDVQPILVGGNDKYGLGKHDPIWSYNHTERYVYDFKLLPEIKIDEYKVVLAKKLLLVMLVKHQARLQTGNEFLLEHLK